MGGLDVCHSEQSYLVVSEATREEDEGRVVWRRSKDDEGWGKSLKDVFGRKSLYCWGIDSQASLSEEELRYAAGALEPCDEVS